jgi:hypothetical protein
VAGRGRRATPSLLYVTPQPKLIPRVENARLEISRRQTDSRALPQDTRKNPSCLGLENVRSGKHGEWPTWVAAEQPSIIGVLSAKRRTTIRAPPALV